MYPDQATQTQEGPARGQLVGGNTLPQPASLLQSALNEQGDQLAKLHDLLARLSERLQPVSCPRPQSEGRGAEQPESVSSMAVGQLRMQTEVVKALQTQVVCLLEELEV